MLRFWIEKIVYGLLVLGVGGVGSLTYFDAFLPDHDAHPYHISLWEQPAHAHNPLPPPPEIVAERLRQQLSIRFSGQPTLTGGQSGLAGLPDYAQAGQRYSCLGGAELLFSPRQPALAARLPAYSAAGRPALLLPPDKPPTAFC